MTAFDRRLVDRREVLAWSLAAAASGSLVRPTWADAEALQPPADTDWPSFRNGNAQLGVAGSSLTDPLEVLWKVREPDGFVATAAIVGDHVYAGSLTGNLLCLQLKDGAPVWKYRTIEDPDPDKFAPGFKAACRVTDKLVLAGDEDGVLHAVDRETGKLRWKFQSDGEIAGCAAIVGPHVIVGSYDSFLYCLKLADGELVWKFQTNDRINCSAAISDRYTFVAGCDEHLRVIDIETGAQRSDIPLNTYLIASPAVDGDILYVGTYASEVVAVNWRKEEVVWRYKDPKREFPYHASAAVTDDLVVVGGQDKQMHAIDRQSGQRVWVFPTRAQINSSPVIAGDRVYFGSNDGNLYGLRLSDGELVWKFNAGKDITAGPAVGRNRLVVGEDARDGALYCFGAKG